ncbi:MAG: hypothetical protein IKB25_08290 [Lentisphaeria bacterium]|nr:hypothetical protein [Lentisphaeria bacterium]
MKYYLKKTMLSISAFALLGFSAELSAAVKDMRPKFDKSGAKGNVTSQANPWFPFNKERIHALGGPNYAHKAFVGKNIWGQGLKLMDEYGFDALYVEINDGGWYHTYVRMLKEAKEEGAKIKLGMFVGTWNKNHKAVLNNLKRNLSTFRNDLKNHPNVYRIDNRPVMLIYTPTAYQPEQWKELFEGLEKEFGPMVFLASLYGMDGTFPQNSEKMKASLEKYIPYFDGISGYGCTGVEPQRRSMAVAAPIMKKYPHKLFEGCALSTYTCHFHMGGLQVDLSYNYRESLDILKKNNVDSINITNLFDHYENSLIFPCYEREDLLFRYAQYWGNLRKGIAFPKIKKPELVLCNPVMRLVGKDDIDFEVLAFPFDSKDTKVKIELEVCDTAGKVLKKFPAVEMNPGKEFQMKKFTLPGMEVANQRGIVPRLTYTWRGKKYQMNYNPMTLLAASIRPYQMYWARSTKNALEVRNGGKPWFINGVGPGGTLEYPQGGVVNFSAGIAPNWGKGKNHGYARHSIKRNGMEFYTITDSKALNMNLALPLPASGEALQFFHLEMENGNGSKHRTLPIWILPPNRKGMVKYPVLMNDGTIKDIEIEEARVPYFYYPCNSDNGNLLVDVSGYMHNGNVAGAGYGGGHLGHTNYYYYHNGPVGPKNGAEFLKDENGKGFYRFNGKNSVTIMGGTALPYASTYEINVRVPKLGKKMGLFGTGNNQISLAIMPDGKLWLQRANEKEGMGGTPPKKIFKAEVTSKDKIEEGKWHRVAVTYDLKKIRLYLDGKLQGEADAPPSEGHEWITHLIVGGLCKWVWTPTDHLNGDIRDIRIYGRALAPEEFLGAEKASWYEFWK